jgi:hypothetical protein
MKTTVNFCGNCPFYVTNYDDFAIGKSTWYTCNLALYLKEQEYFLPDCDEFDEDCEESDNLVSPDWCPLKKEECSFEFNPFSAERLEDIDKNDDEIKKLTDFFEMREDEIDYDDPEFIKKTNQLTELYNKSAELYSNEEPNFEEDINEQLDKIREQLVSLEEVGNKLKDTFNNFGI